MRYFSGNTTGDWTGIEDSRTATPYYEDWWGIYPSYYEICWHRLPCGDCQLTGRPCTHGSVKTYRYEITSNTKTEG